MALLLTTLRALAILLVPDSMYLAATSTLCYASRLAVFVHNLMLPGCSSAMAWYCIGIIHSVFDVTSFLSLSSGSLLAELGYGLFALAASFGTLARCNALGCEVPTNAPARIIAQRLGALVAVYVLHRSLNATRRRGSNSARARGAGGGEEAGSAAGPSRGRAGKLGSPADPVPDPEPATQPLLLKETCSTVPVASAATNGHAAVRTAAAAAAPSHMSVAAAERLARPSRPPYRAFLRTKSLWIKISDVHPDQIPPGWQERVREALAAQGVRLQAAYVRSGCIELVLDLEIHRYDRDDDSPDDVSNFPDPVSDDVIAEAVVAALQLPTGSHVTISAADGTARDPNTSYTCGWGDETAAEGCQVTALSPRVLLLPAPQVPSFGSSLEPCPTGPDATEPMAQLTLRAELGAAWVGASPPEVLVRVEGAYVAARVSAQEEEEQQAGCRAVAYTVEVPLADLAPGLMQVDLRCCEGRPVVVLPVLVLPAEDSSFAEELGAALASMAAAEAPAEALTSCGHFLTDVAVCLFSPSHSQAAELAAHLLDFARADGLPVPARRLQEAAQKARQDGAGDAAGGEPAQAGASARRVGGPWRAVAQAARLSLGLEREAPAEEEAFRAHCNRWAAAQAHTIQALELLALLIVLLRSRGASTHFAILAWITRCAASLVTALAWPLLPAPAWRGLAAAARRWRYAASLGAKVMVLTLAIRAPPGFDSYRSGVGLVLMEGVLLPVTCLLSPPAALGVSALRLPLNARAVGLLAAARVEAVALLATLLAQLYLRLACRKARAERGPAAEGGSAAQAATSRARSDAGLDGAAAAKGIKED
ncbi:hypothetical protein HYH03_007914 [Edaphochlamys debaryana]|uniref:Uncharacterized protein n=1 Tax=Edaphochlamys debaryana TaxID=47281 RepID=A0A835Y2H3_9CHLO|nr:hypothetical protein HYH03_007914 [Edaphochlamys debaryana]|eukprot:KAG2493987.1 hypothetical protein HYH03_007914 [Edaphochlamys debaryana]